MEEIISREDMQKLITALQKKTKDEEIPEVEKIEILKKCLKDYSTPIKFNIGDIVYWKENLKNRRFPEYNDPSIILDVLEKPIFDSSNDSGDSGFKEPLTIKLGTLIRENNESRFVVFYYDGNRFCKK